MKNYLDIVKRILEHGIVKKNRTGVDAITIAGAMFEHDMQKGFPLLTTKKVPFKNVKIELEFFIKGLTDKKWLQQKNTHIWDEWANSQKAEYGHDLEAKARMLKERDLGPIYGFQWRHYGAKYENYDVWHGGQGIDQLKRVINTLRRDPGDRRMIVLAWNPADMPSMALPPCHYAFQVTIVDNKINLLWNQRSVDVMLGLPFNIASYALLLHLLAKESGFKEGKLIGFLADTHIYVNHVDGAKEQLGRDSNRYELPRIKTKGFDKRKPYSIFRWKSEDTELIGYESHPRIPFQIAV